MVARWSSSPTAPTSSWLPALPTWQAASIAIAGNDGSRCRKGRFVGKVLDFVGNLLAIVDLFDQTRSAKKVHDSLRLNQKKNWKAASKHHWHHSKSYHQGSSSRPSKHLKTAAQPELLAVDTGTVRLWAARQLGDNEQRCAMNIRTTTLGDPYTILASANVRFSPYDLIPGWNLQKGICFLTFCVLLRSFPLIKMVEAARRLSLFFAVGWLKFCELPSPVKELESLKIDVARIFGSNIGSKTDRVFVDLQSFLVIPICWKPSIWFFSFSQTWASMAATAKHVSEISAFSYHPIHLPQGSNIPGHLDSQRQWGRLFLHPIEQVFHGDSAALQSPSRSFSKTWLHVWRAFSNRLLPNEGVFDLLRGNNRCSVLRVFSADSPQAWNMTADSYENNCRFFNRHHFFDGIFFERHLDSDGFENTPQLHFLPGKCSFVETIYHLEHELMTLPGKPVEPRKVWLANSSRIHPPPARLVWYDLFDMIFVYL